MLVKKRLPKQVSFEGGLVKFGRSYIGVCYLSSFIEWVLCPFHLFDEN